MSIWKKLVGDEQGQDVAEYAVMLAVVLMLALATLHYVAINANNRFTAVASQIQ